MKYKIAYNFNPLTYKPRPKQADKANRYISKGQNAIRNKLSGRWSKVNMDKNAKKVIKGFSYLYGFKPRKFLTDNFYKQNGREYLLTNHYHLTDRRWIKCILHLRQQLNTIRNYSNIRNLITGRFKDYIQIRNIDKIYHPKKKHFAKNKRTKLAKLGNKQRYLFTGTFIRAGLKQGSTPTLLLIDIKHDGQLVAQHAWFNYTKSFLKVGELRAGNEISFKARVQAYKKGYVPSDFIQHIDYQLSYPTNVKLLGVNPKQVKSLPLSKKKVVSLIKKQRYNYLKKH